MMASPVAVVTDDALDYCSENSPASESSICVFVSVRHSRINILQEAGSPHSFEEPNGARESNNASQNGK